MDWWRNKNVPECSKVRILGLVRKNSYRGTSPCSVPKVAFWENGKKVCVGYCFVGGNCYIACVRLLCCCCVCSWLLLVVPPPYLKRFVLGWLRAGDGIYPLYAWSGLNGLVWGQIWHFSIWVLRVCACVYVCGWVANVADYKKMKKVCKIVAVGVYIIAEWRKWKFFSLGIDFLKNQLYLCPCNSLELQDVLWKRYWKKFQKTFHKVLQKWKTRANFAIAFHKERSSLTSLKLSRSNVYVCFLLLSAVRVKHTESLKIKNIWLQA